MLRRPNATFELDEPTLRTWEEAAAKALSEGSDGADHHLQRHLASLVTAAPLPQNDKMRNLIFTGGEDVAAHFVALLQRARLHRHVPTLLNALDSWEKHTSSSGVWDVIELIESLRARHVFPMMMLRLAEHEWDSIVSEAAHGAGKAPHSFDADQ